jgi:hypothetical protein
VTIADDDGDSDDETIFPSATFTFFDSVIGPSISGD